MDLGTVMARLQGHQYTSFHQVAADVDLVGGCKGQGQGSSQGNHALCCFCTHRACATQPGCNKADYPCVACFAHMHMWQSGMTQWHRLGCRGC
jgi:hypothetical protein